MRWMMKASKGKEFLNPDEAYIISEYKYIKKNKNKRFYVRVFNKKIRNFFKKLIRKEVSNDK